MKLMGVNCILSDKFGIITQDVFSGDADHYKDGFHQVLVGFGDGDNSHGSYLELATGRHSWPFYFKLPYYAPPTYFDGRISMNYKVVATFESPVIQASNNKMMLSYEHVAPNGSHFAFVRLKETQISENKYVILNAIHFLDRSRT